jgi:hypothetical protein
VAVFAAAMLTTAPALAGQSAGGPDCPLEFGLHMIDLRADIGDAMGQPLDCEAPIDSAGDTMQVTSTGTAWYTRANHAEIFTDGYQRWELDPSGLTYWSSPGAVPLLLDGLPDGPAMWTKAVTCPVLYTHEVPVAASFQRFSRA